MQKIYAFLILLILPMATFAQRFSQYFTNTMAESFENPAQGIFKTDTTRMLAFNLFIPNLTASAYTIGNATTSIKQYLFLHNSTFPNLTIGQNKFNTANGNTNVYLVMFKVFTDQAGKSEIGFSWQVRGEANANFTDETVQLFDGGSKYANNTVYSGLFNDNYYVQAYHQFSFTYRETLNKIFSLGFKLSALSGAVYDKTYITNSEVTFDKTNELLLLTLAGQHKTSYTLGQYSSGDALPDFKNPGLSLSVGVSQHNEDGVYLQYNIKDLGFIHWGANAHVYNFSQTDTVSGLNTSQAGKNVYNTANYILQQGGESKSFTTATNGLAEVSATKYYWLDYDKKFRYNPVIIASKQLFYKGLAGALINNIQYGKITLGLVTSYDNYNQFNMGGRFMFKAANAEFFVGSEQLLTSYNLERAHRGNLDYTNSINNYTGAGLFFGFALKFGPEIESPANSSHIPMGGEDGFLKRLFKDVFTKHQAYTN